MAISVGTVLKGQYRIDALIGGGGMATVYRAYDTNLQRVCAIKQNMDTSTEAQRQFHLEAILLAGLSHPHLARVTDHFVDAAGQQYLVMDFVEGENLESYVARNGPVPEAKALAWMAGVLDAVAYCHGQGVIHRDIKPANLVKRSGRDTVVLVDFGIAKQQLGGMTLAGARAATPAYAPLEQFTGHTDARSDVYALGSTLYYLLTGVEPPDSRLAASGVEHVAPLRSLNPQVSARTEQAVRQAMALRVGDRPQNVADLARALAGQQPPTSKPNPRPTRPLRMRASLAALVMVAVLAMLAMSIFAVSQLADGWSANTPTATVAAMVPLASPETATTSITVDVIASLPSPETDTPSPASVLETATMGATLETDTAIPAAASETPGGGTTPTEGRPPTSTPALTDAPTAPPTRIATATQLPVTATPTKPPPSGSAAPVIAPTLQSPPNGSEQRNVVTLQWIHGGLLPGQQYRVDLRTDYNQPEKTLFLLSQATSLQVRFDQYPEFFKDDNTTFFWSVLVINAVGNVSGGRSVEWRFVLKRNESPPAATDTPEPQTPEPSTPQPPTAEPPTPEPAIPTPTPRG